MTRKPAVARVVGEIFCGSEFNLAGEIFTECDGKSSWYIDRRFYLGSDRPLDLTFETNDKSADDSIDIINTSLWEMNCL